MVSQAPGRGHLRQIMTYPGLFLFFFFLAVIPLAKKLKDCGVFGVASEEYLTYAVANRREWEARGKAIVNDMVNKVNNAKEELTSG